MIQFLTTEKILKTNKNVDARTKPEWYKLECEKKDRM